MGATGVEEFIRWVTPILNMRRTATEDHELHGQTIAAGDELLLMYSSANRDERVFADPEQFDVTREHNHHVAFGFGTHFCLGASLARLEIRVMFEELLRRMPDWRLAPGADPDEVLPSAFACGYDAIPIELTRDDGGLENLQSRLGDLCHLVVDRVVVGRQVHDRLVLGDLSPELTGEEALTRLAVLPEVDPAVDVVVGVLQPDLRKETRLRGHHLGELPVGLVELGITDVGQSIGQDLNSATATFRVLCGPLPI